MNSTMSLLRISILSLIFICLNFSGLGALAHAAGVVGKPAAICHAPWPAWESFKQAFVSSDGRIVDQVSDRKHSTSEGQAYALFFALLANDRKSFDAILAWTENNLAQGDLTAHLPAWQWGQKDDKSWGVIDENSASDADLWLAYSLGEAGRLWGERRYVALSSLLASRILREEVADLPGLGPTLLPAPKGFALADNRWKLNPSYLPIQLLRRFVRPSADPLWTAILHSTTRILRESAPKGYAPDWILYDANKGFLVDSQGAEKGAGGFNAIRVYLWLGLLATDAPERKVLLDNYRPFAQLIGQNGYPPLSVDVSTGAANQAGPAGFSAAALPFLHALSLGKSHDEQILRIDAMGIRNDAYYDQVLALFALGWNNRLYSFDKDGNLTPQWLRCN